MKIFNLIIIASSVLLFACGGGSSSEDALRKLDSLNQSLSAMGTEDATNMSLYTNEDGKFKVNFPGTPTISNESIPTEVGNIEMVMFTYEKSVTEVYMVAYSDYPSEMVKASDAKTLLEGAKSGAVENQGIVLEEETEVKLDENPGLAFKGKAGSIHMVYRIYLAGNRMYQIVLLKDGGYPSSENVASYFDSFQIIK